MQYRFGEKRNRKRLSIFALFCATIFLHGNLSPTVFKSLVCTIFIEPGNPTQIEFTKQEITRPTWGDRRQIRYRISWQVVI